MYSADANGDVDDVPSEGAVALELRFVKELIGGRFVREIGMAAGIVEHVGRLLSRERWFQIHKQAIGSAGIDQVVPDPADRVMSLAACRAVLSSELADVQLNLDTQIDANFSDRVSQV